MIRKKYFIIVILSFLLIIAMITSISLVIVSKKENRNNKVVQKVEVVEKAIPISELSSKINLYLENLPTNNIAVYITDLISNETIKYNEEKIFFAASTYKLALSMLYIDKEYALDSTLYFPSNAYEDGPILDKYRVGDMVPLSELIHYSLTYSDNTASNILWLNYGGWNSFLYDASLYSKNTYYYDISYGDNFLNAVFLNDVVNHLYKDQNRYAYLIEQLKIATQGGYLDHHRLGVDVAQKYGDYDGAYNAVGIVYAKKPFSIVVLTQSYPDGEKIIGDISKLSFEHFNK